MTTNVKGAGRRRYEANKRHQQRTPLPARGSTAQAEARAIIKEEADKLMEKESPKTKLAYARALEAENKAAEAKAKREAKAEKPERVSKAQQLALAAEEAGWDVERHVDGAHKTLIATRGDEQLEAHWDNDRSCVPLGWHTVAGNTAKFQHVTVALKIVGTDPEVAATNAANAKASRKAPRAVTHRSLAQGVPFNAATALDTEVLEALAGREVSWRNVLSNGEITETAIVPLSGKQTRLLPDDLEDLSTRQLTFCDAEGGGYRSLRLGQLASVGALKDEGGHMLTNSLHNAMLALKGDKK